MHNRVKILTAFALVLFILAEFIFNRWVEAISGYGFYFFEVFFVVVVLLLFKDFNWFKKEKLKRGAILVFLTGVLGAWVHVAAFFLNIKVPFDFESGETILFLLLLGPLLEESLFRLGLWRLLEVFTKRKWILVTLTAIAFSFSHFKVILMLPMEYRPFIIYQSVYTFILGLICGNLRFQYGFVAALLAHLLFNLGFWLAR